MDPPTTAELWELKEDFRWALGPMDETLEELEHFVGLYNGDK